MAAIPDARDKHNWQSFFGSLPTASNTHLILQTAVFLQEKDNPQFRAATEEKIADYNRDGTINIYIGDAQAKAKQLAEVYFQSVAKYQAKNDGLKLHKEVETGAKFLASAIGGKGAAPLMGAVFLPGTLSFKFQIAHLKKKKDKDLDLLLENLDAAGLKAKISAMTPQQQYKEIQELMEKKVWSKAKSQALSLSESTEEQINRAVFEKLQGPLEQKDTFTVYGEPTFQAIKKLVSNFEAFTSYVQKTSQAVQQTQKDVKAIKADITSMSTAFQALAYNSEEQLKLSRFMVDAMYSKLTTEEKLDALKRGYYPDKVGEISTLQILQKWEKAEETMLLWTGLADGALFLAQQIGIKVPRDLQKGIMGAQSAFYVAMGVSVGDPSMIINGIKGLATVFKKTNSDPQSLMSQQIAEIGKSVVEAKKMIADLHQDLMQLIELNLEMNQTLHQIGTMIVKQHAEIMQALAQIDRDVLYTQRIIKEEIFNDLERFDDLRQALSEVNKDGFFNSYETAQSFFRDHGTDYFSKPMDRIQSTYPSLDISVKAIALLRPDTEDDNMQIGSLHYFLEKTWGSTKGFYNQLKTSDQQNKEALFAAFFDPLTHVDDIQLLAKKPSQALELTMQSIAEFCRLYFNGFIDPSPLLKMGANIIEFHRYWPLMANLQANKLVPLDQLIQPHFNLQLAQKRGKKLLMQVLAYTHLSIIQHHALSGGPLIPLIYRDFFACLSDNIEKLQDPKKSIEEKKAVQAEVKIFVDLLTHNPLLKKNAMLYAVRKLLNIQPDDPEINTKCMRYRLAYHHSLDSSQLKTLLPGWLFVPSKDTTSEKTWSLRLPSIQENNEDLLIALPHPTDLFHGKLIYPQDLTPLVEQRDQLIQELLTYDILQDIHSYDKQHKTDLKTTVAENFKAAAGFLLQ